MSDSEQYEDGQITVGQAKPKLGFWEIWNMSFGFLGIQFGFALQLGNTSRIFQTLGAPIEDLAILWIAAPVTGLLVQPVIGYLSDRTWHPRWGRRRPFFLIGAIMACISLILMPNSSVLWMAAGMLWIMDTAFNVSMEPFRAFVGDKLPGDQRTLGFVMQSFFIGIGAFIASYMPWAFDNWFNVSNEAPDGVLPNTVKYSYYIGAAVFLLAVSWTVFTSKEYPPDDMDEFLREKEETKGVANAFKSIAQGMVDMPKTMIQLAVVQFFSWFGLFAMWIYTSPAVIKHLYGSPETNSEVYNEGANWVSRCFGDYNIVAAIVAFGIPVLAKYSSRRVAHMICLFAGAIGLYSITMIDDPAALRYSMIGIGIAWASILAMPYAILVGALPEGKMGYYVGVFNFFIVIPQMIAAGLLGFLLKSFAPGESILVDGVEKTVYDPMAAMTIGAVSFVIAGLLCMIVTDDDGKAPLASH